MSETTRNTVTRVATTTVVVTDLQRAVDFYVHDLGLQVVRDAELGRACTGSRWAPQVKRMGDAAPPMSTVRDPDGNVLVLVEGA